MKFKIEGSRTKVMIVNESISGEIAITKAEVMRVTGCSSVEDGDSTAWYDYVGEAIEGGANFKIVQLAVEEPDEIESDEPAAMTIHSVEWYG